MSKACKALLTILLVAVIGVLVFIYADANISHYTARMESDIASETLLAEVLYENGHAQPDTWQMSTGRRIVAPPNLASFLYPLVGYDLNVSMGLACTLMMILLIASMLFFNRQIGLSILESLVAIALSLMLCSVENETQKHIYLYAAYYVFHFTCMFFVLGIYARALKNDKLPVVLSIITIPLALINGMQGLHASMFFYMPLLGAEIIRRIVLLIKKKKSCVLVTSWVVLISLGSVVSAKVFGTHLDSQVSRNFRHAPEKFRDVVWPLFKEVLGYGRMPVLVAVFVILGIAGYIIGVTKYKEKPGLWSALPIVFGVIVPVLSTTFSTTETASRYYLIQIYVVAVGVALFINLVKPDVTMWLAVLVVFYGVISATAFYQGLIKNDNSGNPELAQIAEYLLENGYDYGYANFDNANMTTVISNNKVKVRPVNSYSEMEGAKWLSDSTWYPPVKNADEPVFYLVNSSRVDEFKEFCDRVNPVIVKEKSFDSFVVYITDRDYTVWAD